MEFLNYGGMPTIIIICIGGLATYVFIERILFLYRTAIKVTDFLSGITNVLKQGNRKEAIILCEETPGPVAVITRAAIAHFSDSRDNLKKAIYDAGRKEAYKIEKRFAIISLISHIAPLLGLFGTVAGITEYAIVIHNGVMLLQIGEIAPGIFKAIISTITGLAVAIITSVEYNLLIMRMDKLITDMEYAALEMETFIINLRKN